jgi:hypothetical protein
MAPDADRRILAGILLRQDDIPTTILTLHGDIGFHDCLISHEKMGPQYTSATSEIRIHADSD